MGVGGNWGKGDSEWIHEKKGWDGEMREGSGNVVEALAYTRSDQP